MKLNEIADKPGARKGRLRVGRGIGSGKGKTAARGVKGQKSRSGVAIKGFEGGQMPIHMRLPKRGFNKPNRFRFVELGLDRIQEAIDAGKLKADEALTEDRLVAAGLVRRKRDGIRLLANGTLTSPITVTVSGASNPAKAAIEAAGGSFTVAERVVPAEKKDAKTEGEG